MCSTVNGADVVLMRVLLAHSVTRLLCMSQLLLGHRAQTILRFVRVKADTLLLLPRRNMI